MLRWCKTYTTTYNDQVSEMWREAREHGVNTSCIPRKLLPDFGAFAEVPLLGRNLVKQAYLGVVGPLFEAGLREPKEIVIGFEDGKASWGRMRLA